MKVGFSLIWESHDEPVGQTVIYQLMNDISIESQMITVQNNTEITFSNSFKG